MDIVRGYVTNVLDGDTFEIDIDWRAPSNDHPYQDIERVRLADVNAPELHQPGGEAAHARLRRQIQGQRVQVKIRARDRYGRVLGEYRVLTEAARMVW